MNLNIQVGGPAWEQARPQVLTALRLTDPVTALLSDLAGGLDAAYLGLAARLGPAASGIQTHRPGWNPTAPARFGCT